jgi:hypothetical protein
MMTLQQYRERFEPLVQSPVPMRRATWLDADALQWSFQDPGVLDVGERAFELIRHERALRERVQVD